MDKKNVVHVDNGILLSHNREWNIAICSIMDGSGDYHNKWSKSGRERQILHDITYAVLSHSVMSDSVTSWTGTHQAPLSMGILQGKNTGVRCHALLHAIFPTQGSKPGLQNCRWILYHLSHQGSLRILEWVAYPFSRGSSQTRNSIRVSCISGRFFTSWATREAQYHLYVESKIWHNKTETDSQTQRTDMWLPVRRASREETDLELGISRFKLLYIEWINKVLLYSTGKCVQHLVINHNGKEYEKECVYICMHVCVCVYVYMIV